MGRFGFIGIDLLTRCGDVWVGALGLALDVAAAPAPSSCIRVRSPSWSSPFDLLRNPVFSLSVLASGFAAQLLAFVSLSFFLVSSLHRGQVQTGLLMTPWPLAVGIGAPIAGRLADELSAAALGAAGLLVLCAGLALSAALPVKTRLRGDSLANSLVRPWVRVLPGPQQSLDAIRRAAFPQRGGWRVLGSHFERDLRRDIRPTSPSARENRRPPAQRPLPRSLAADRLVRPAMK